METYLLLHRAININDVELYSFALYELAPIFFTTNHHNYARWMTYYALELSNHHNDKPEVFELLQKGAFSVNRSGKPFSGVGVDRYVTGTDN